MTSDDPGLDLPDGMARTGMTFEELWLRQLALGGPAGRLEVEAYVLGVLAPDAYQHDLLAQALNEWSLERGGDHPVGYWGSTPAG
ncbi:MAG: hypothetical protein AVDCRST_MAG41-3667 [uncultured Corynebacteriales bacterium]|uniref:Uncharacterized protein n=1 Tax=uncultured Mycobacteriales bacterium TaxID=581187 RepID=A0A6J4JLG6_9ACTN|nr:MAG: hypothetical protein AVDCRST_MAG41-3667 [uncultured Corynebacteriales bacterium]